MSDEDGFDEQESKLEHWTFIVNLIGMGAIAILAATAKWWKRLLFVVVLLLLPSTAAAQAETATHLALGAYMTAAFFDTSITSYAIGQGVAHEANPFLRPIVENHGVVTAMTIKGGLHVGIAALILKYHKTAPKRTFWITVGLTAAQVAVDVANVRTVNR